ncbi:NAD-dependent epimerase/dehydratase family protein [Oleiharenicola sp. Vm1]|uniref:NAD-dependent epimerase/dehydratase family protein n=1 Tax=Oleiharenicola sp. Vm1 TaxID=3398393 RepID=UPI0039F56A7F
MDALPDFLRAATQPFVGKRVLVTGGIGFIGSNLARILAQAGAHVTVVDSLIPEYGGNLANLDDAPAGITINIADVRDQFSLRYLVQGQDVLFNLAGQTSHLDSMRDPFTDLDINAKAQLAILEACRHFNPGIEIVFASTRQIYGKPQYLPVDERHPIRPVDVNGVNKAAGEQFHQLYHDVYGLRTRVLRLTNTYGPRMRIKDARQTFLGIWIKQILTDIPVEVWEGNQLRDFNYVDDVVAALLNVTQHPDTTGAIFNLGSTEKISLLDLAHRLVEIAGQGTVAIKSFPAERKKIDIGDYYSDFRKIEAAIGWRPQVALSEGLCATVDYFRRHLDRYT